MDVKIPNGAKAEISPGMIKISGKLGSTTKVINEKLLDVKVSGDTITVTPKKPKNIARKAELASQAFCTCIKNALDGVQNGIERKMTSVSAHFPMTIEAKGNVLTIKNIFGERFPRTTAIVGDTKIEVKGNEVKVKGVDPYDVGQTITNIRKLCKSKDKDTRVFQDGLYLVREE